MKLTLNILSLAISIILGSCTNSPTEIAQSSINNYLKENLKNYQSYEPLSYSKLDTLNIPDSLGVKNAPAYQVTHFYHITNSQNDLIKMSITFFLDKDFKIKETFPKSLNGEYGSLTGNAYWKYNDYVGNKPDAGAEIQLHSLDTIRGNLRFEATADVQGDYQFSKLPPGRYLVIVRSNNTRACPEEHLINLGFYSSYLKQIFGFDLSNYTKELAEIERLDSMATSILTGRSNDFYKSTSSIDAYYELQEQSRDKINKLFESFPTEFRIKMKLFSGFSNSYDIQVIEIEDGKSANLVSDFGITCI